MSVNALTYCTNCWYPGSFSMHRNLIVSLRLLLYVSLTGLRLSHFTVTGSTRTQLRFSTRFRIKFVRRTCRTAAMFLLRVWGFCARDSHRFFCGYGMGRPMETEIQSPRQPWHFPTLICYAHLDMKYPHFISWCCTGLMVCIYTLCLKKNKTLNSCP